MSSRPPAVRAAFAAIAVTLAWSPHVAAAQLVINGDYTNATALNAGTGQPQTTITINNSQFTQSAGGSLNALNGGTVSLNNVNVIGGLLTQSGTGRITFNNSGSNLLTGVTLAGALDLATSTGQVQVRSGLTLGNGGGSTGTINVNSNSSFILRGTQTIGGTGTIVFGGTGSGNNVAVDGLGGGATVTIGPNVTIRGENGTIGNALYEGGARTLVNNGTISADVAGGTITITSAPVTNNGTLGAANGGTLLIQSTVTNGATGQLTATNNGITRLNGVTVTGGTIVTSTGGVLAAANNGNNFLSATTLNGTIDLASTTGQVRVTDGLALTSGSVINVNNNSSLILTGTQTLSGTGTIVLGGTGGGNTIGLDNTSGGSGAVLTIGPNVTIRGQNGTIGQSIYVGGPKSIVNNGTIAADVAGGTITLGDQSPITNNGVLRAANGGTLYLNGSVAGGAGSQIAADAGSTVFQNGVVVSGQINTTGTGAFRATNNSNNYLDAVTLSGKIDLATGTGVERVTNGLTLQGGASIAVNANSSLIFAGTQTLGGTGTITLGNTGSGNTIGIDNLSGGSGAVLTIGSGVTITGENGTIGNAVYVGGPHSIVNNGTIGADVAGGTVTLSGQAPITNNGVLRATNGGTLVLSGDVTGSPTSQIVAGAGSTVLQNGVTVSGQINTSGSGAFRATNNGNNYLNGVTLNGAVDLASATGVERVTNGLTFTSGSAINVNSNSSLIFTGTQTVGGTGTIVLGSTGSGNTIGFDNLSGGSDAVLTIGSGVTIRGQSGTIGNAVYVGGPKSIVNNGTIRADVAGGTVTLSGQAPVTNNGTLGALNGGTLVLSGNVAGGAASQYATDASSTILQNGVALSGRVNVTGGGSIQATNNGNNYLDGATLGGRLDLATATGVERVTNGLTLGVGATNGTIDVNSNSSLIFAGTQTLGGTGTITLGNTGSGNTIGIDNVGSGGGAVLTIGPNVTVQGTNGTIGNSVYVGGAHSLVNAGTINSNGGGLLTITSQAPITNNGLLRAQSGALTIQSPLSGTGTLRVDAAGTVNLTSGQPVTQGTLAVGATGATLNNGVQNITLSADYTNASAGSGNTFDRRAGLTGSGQVLAGGDVAQRIGGTNVTNGSTTNATLTIGNVRVGSTTYTYTVDNTGTTGPALRGAIQTGVNGGNVTDSRLSGSGVTAGLYGPATTGSSSGPYNVTFTQTTAGAIAPLSGQAVNLRSTYENIADQKLNIVVGSGAGAYVAAQGQLNTPALNFGTVQVGQVVTQNLSFTNSATGPAGYVEDLNVSVGGTSGTGASRISGTGAVTGLAAGATGGGITVNVNTSSAGTVNGAIALNYTSAGAVNGVSNGLGTLAVGGTSYGVSGTIITATVIDQAQPVINNPTINLGNVRINATSPTANVSVTNQSTGASGQAALNASITGNAPVTASGSFNLLNPGATNASSLSVGISTTTAGVRSGTATVAFVSDASNVGGCGSSCQMALPSQNVNVTGTVYRLANPSVTPTNVTLAARVGGTATRAISVTNSSPDAYTESLNASFAGAAPAGFTTSGSVNALAAQGTSNALTVGLNTAAAGTYTGTATINAVSTGAGTTGAADVAVGSTNVSLTGKVYTVAVGQTSPTIDFGIVHVGDVVSRTISVKNAAPVTALNDVLRGAASGGGPAFTASGTLGAGVAAGATDNTSLSVALNTATNGSFTGTASVALTSHDDDLADLSLGTSSVALTGQVNNYAQGGFAKTGGAGAFSMTGANAYLLDFGTILLGGGAQTANLGVDNLATGFADLLNGSFLTSNTVGTGFSFFGFNAFSNLAAGNRLGGLSITFNGATAASYTGTVTLNDFGTNASGYMGALAPITLTVRGTVTTTVAAVPEPSTWIMFGTGLVGVCVFVRRRRSAN